MLMIAKAYYSTRKGSPFARGKERARHAESRGKSRCEGWENGRERDFTASLRQNPSSLFTPLFLSPSFPCSSYRNLPHPRKSFRRMKTLLFMRHVQACREFSGKGTAQEIGCFRIRAMRARVPSCVWMYVCSSILATLCEFRGSE